MAARPATKGLAPDQARESREPQPTLSPSEARARDWPQGRKIGAGSIGAAAPGSTDSQSTAPDSKAPRSDRDPVSLGLRQRREKSMKTTSPSLGAPMRSNPPSTIPAAAAAEASNRKSVASSKTLEPRKTFVRVCTLSLITVPAPPDPLRSRFKLLASGV